MKKTFIFYLAFAACVAGSADLLLAQSGSKWFQLHNRLRIEYDDNWNQSEDNEQSSLKAIEEVEAYFNLYLDTSFLSLRYRPQFVWWDDREGDDSDFHHDLDFVFNHAFSPRVNLNTKDTFRIGESPELIENGVVVREKDDFTYNAFNATLGFVTTPESRLEFAGRHTMLSYDNEEVAQQEDYTIYTAGLNYRQQLVPETSLQGELRYEQMEYDANQRGSDSIQFGGSLEHSFSPSFLGSTRAGYMQKSFETNIDDETSPYFDANFTVIPSPATRISGGVGYSLRETEVFPYTNQERLSFLASMAHDLTARLALYASLTYYISNLDGEQTLDTVQGAPDGEEKGIQLSSKLSYRINRSNTLELNWQFVDLSTDVREDYVRNRLSVGWKTEL